MDALELLRPLPDLSPATLRAEASRRREQADWLEQLAGVLAATRLTNRRKAPPKLTGQASQPADNSNGAGVRAPLLCSGADQPKRTAAAVSQPTRREPRPRPANREEDPVSGPPAGDGRRPTPATPSPSPRLANGHAEKVPPPSHKRKRTTVPPTGTPARRGDPRLLIAEHILTAGPAPLKQLADVAGLPWDQVHELVRGDDWFEREADGVHLTHAGRLAISPTNGESDD